MPFVWALHNSWRTLGRSCGRYVARGGRYVARGGRYITRGGRYAVRVGVM